MSVRSLQVVFVSVLAVPLASCGGAAGGCSGVEIEERPYRGTGTFNFAIRNSSDDPRLVTVGWTNGVTGDVTENTIRVDAKDIVEQSVGPMRQEARENGSISLIQCE